MHTIALPFVYSTVAIPRRATTARPIRVLDTIAVQVLDASFTSLPLAGRMTGADRSAEFRMLGDGFLSSNKLPGILDIYAARMGSLDKWRLANRMVTTGIPALDKALDPELQSKTPLMTSDEFHATVREVVSSDDMERRDSILKDVVPRLCVMDGKLHFALGEPVWSVAKGADPDAHARMKGVAFLHVDHSILRDACFRVDRKREAVEFAGGNDHDVPFEFEDAGIHDWSFDETKQVSKVLFRRVERELANVMFFTMAKCPASFFDSYCKLRDWKQHEIDTLVEAIPLLQAALPAGPSHSGLRASIEEAISDWRWIVDASAPSLRHDDLIGFQR